MVDYMASVSDVSASRPLRILTVGDGFPLDGVGHHIIVPASSDPVGDLKAEFPDLLLLDASRATEDMARTLATAPFQGLPVIVLADAGNADQAGLLLGAGHVRFLDEDATADDLARAVQDVQSVEHAADSGEVFNPLARIEALKRDAERVATALAELMQGTPPAAQESMARPVTADRIRAHIKARRAREKFFPIEIMADPAWDMLLDLAAARLEGRPVSVSSLCIAACVPTTTGLRWIKNMIDRGYFERTPDPDDGRRAFVAMSEPTVELMDACLEAALNFPGQ